MYNYSNEQNKKSVFICLPSNNFGYGFPTCNNGFIYIEKEEDGSQDITNTTY